MRSRIFVVLGLSGLLVVGACSSSTDDVPNAKANSAPGTNINGTTVPASAESANSNTVANGIIVAAPQTVDANSGAVTSADPMQPSLPATVSNKLDKMASSAGTADAANLAGRNARPAPDDSTFTSFLTDAGYEIRTFRSHPNLMKVEKRIGSNGSQTVKVFLRGGKVVEVRPEKIGSLATASADSIAAAAGIGTAPVKAPAPGSTGAKKPGI